MRQANIFGPLKTYFPPQKMEECPLKRDHVQRKCHLSTINSQEIWDFWGDVYSQYKGTVPALHLIMLSATLENVLAFKYFDPKKRQKFQPATENGKLVGGFNPFEKYAQVKLDHFPQGSG